MVSSPQPSAEQKISEVFGDEEFTQAAQIAISAYGAELYGFIKAIHRDEQEAREVLSEVNEELTKGFRTFDGRCSFRTWAYAIARRCSAKRLQTRSPDQVATVTPITSAKKNGKVDAEAERKAKIRALRDRLPEEDRALLVLRVDRKLEWNDLAHIYIASLTGPKPPSLGKVSAVLRKRFDKIKERMRRLAFEEGLLYGNTGS
jgi:RNA polymerase sigma-70 factor, ECF subfamily